MNENRIVHRTKQLACAFCALCISYGTFAGGSISLRKECFLKTGAEPVSAGDVVGPQAAETQVQPRKVALTFDDGPGRYTDELLTELKERGVKATFFVVGSNAKLREDTVKRMYEEGHLVGNHTYSHVELDDMSVAAALEELEKTNEVLEDITGARPEFVRPPYGAWNDCLQAQSQMITVMWDVDPLDWQDQNCSRVADCVLKEVEDGDIILLHDIYQSSVIAALEIVDTLLAQGYEFVTADELILD